MHLHAAMAILAGAAIALCAAAQGAAAAVTQAPMSQSDCQAMRQEYRNEGQPHLPIRALAESEVALITEPVVAGAIDLGEKKLAKVRPACYLKGHPGGTPLTVNLQPTGLECVDTVQLEGVVGDDPVDQAFVLLLRRRPVSGTWDLLDGGLYPADGFFRRMSRVCNLTTVYPGANCRSDEAPNPGCLSLRLWTELLKLNETPPLYVNSGVDNGVERARPSGHRLEESATGFVSDHPSAGAKLSNADVANGAAGTAGASLLVLLLAAAGGGGFASC